jgi:hypothetical protein
MALEATRLTDCLHPIPIIISIVKPKKITHFIFQVLTA